MSDDQQVRYLSFVMSPASPVPPAIQPAQIRQKMQVSGGDEANVYRVSFDNHSNTHVDAPAHVIADGLCITDFALADFLFYRPVVVDLSLPDGTEINPDHIKPHLGTIRDADMVLFRLGYGPVRREDPQRYATRCPGFGVAGAEFLRRELPYVRAVGMDVPSFVCIESIEKTMRGHNVMLEGEGRRCLLIEDMDLEINLDHLRQVRLVPWLIEGIDSSPCTVLGIFDD